MDTSSYRHPEGGYGWVIVFASGGANFIVLSIIQCFGIVLKETFADLKLSATQIALILNLNVSFGMLTGPIGGVLQKKLGCRKVAFLAALFTTCGICVTSVCTNFVSFLIAFGLLTSVGIEMTESTYRLSINTYFKKKRSVVTGFVMTGAGFAPIIISHLLSFLLKIYTPEQTTLIYGGICANLFIFGILLRPVKTESTKEEMVVLDKRTPNSKNMIESVVQLFDLDLLKDPIFVNIILGVSLVTFAELNFTLLMPFILNDYGLSTDEIAIFLSTLGISDMIFRFVSPYIGNYFTQPSRTMYAYSLVLLVIVKFIFLLSKDYKTLLAIALIMGIAKGFRKVYMWLVIPDYVPLKKLPTAAGIDLLARGAFILIGGTILGTLRDATGSYTYCILVMNGVTISALVLWTVEALIVRYKKKKQRISENNNISN